MLTLHQKLKVIQLPRHLLQLLDRVLEISQSLRLPQQATCYKTWRICRKEAARWHCAPPHGGDWPSPGRRDNPRKGREVVVVQFARNRGFLPLHATELEYVLILWKYTLEDAIFKLLWSTSWFWLLSSKGCRIPFTVVLPLRNEYKKHWLSKEGSWTFALQFNNPLGFFWAKAIQYERPRYAVLHNYVNCGDFWILSDNMWRQKGGKICL